MTARSLAANRVPAVANGRSGDRLNGWLQGRGSE
jgi:hypothetical protein